MNLDVLKFFINKRVKLNFKIKGYDTFYEGRVLAVDEEAITFTDKFNRLVVLRLEFLSKIEEIKELGYDDS